eukprot:TRINITY_DN28710_c0_g1_i1.p3 TRINITY_DN28710_c0_g1~~TRINITY_DN28710_c0_g1_i1.p3  ORF type:complete len:134 (+),score=12.34 TRINITY_DN28710_c0_g1_i1:36-404(+)
MIYVEQSGGIGSENADIGSYLVMGVSITNGAQKHEFEFFGPTLGPCGIIFGLPIVCYALIFMCNAAGCLNLQELIIPQIPDNFEFFNLQAMGVVLGWFTYLIGMHFLVPGQLVDGAVARLWV